MSEELKPCPFCGCRATSITDAENVRITGSHSAACPFRDVDVIVDSRDAWDTRAELAAIKAGQGEAVAEVLSNRIGNDTATIDKALRPGTKLYTALPVSADAVSVPDEWRDMLEELQWQWEAADDHFHIPSGHYCPSCRNSKGSGHADHCQIAALLATATPAAADARLVPVELLERVCVDRCYPAGHTMSIRAIDDLRALLAQSQGVKS